MYLEFQALLLEPHTSEKERSAFSSASLIHRFCFNRIPEDTDLTDFNFNNVTWFHEDLGIAFKADTARSSTDDHITWLKARKPGDIVNKNGDRKYQKISRRMLHDFTVEACGQGKGAWIGYLIGGDEPRAEWAGMAKIFTRRELAGVSLCLQEFSNHQSQ